MLVMMWDTCCGWMKRKGFRERISGSGAGGFFFPASLVD
jgi:hypothetical protein